MKLSCANCGSRQLHIRPCGLVRCMTCLYSWWEKRP